MNVWACTTLLKRPVASRDVITELNNDWKHLLDVLIMIDFGTLEVEVFVNLFFVFSNETKKIESGEKSQFS